ncbi:MAG: hypothetical protein CME31_02095 [Gimesia sp.]|uniref:Carboxypeptidase regulatory-like domain-containing protein n=1 Tax=Gimesia maris TaxID=122 RepID=A0A3D3RDK9_9PLAN|nr:hypothetical protein [Gimesia sp.]HCO26913.1 hypothetical protein [Gimesia maris]
MISKSLTLLFCLSILLSGCGASKQEFSRAAVSGIVKLDGDPLSEGVIRFIPQGENKGPKASATIHNGIFSIDENFGPVTGTNRIEIDSTDDGGYAPDDELAIEKLKASGIKQIKVVKVPPQYNRRSTLTKTITAEGKNDLVFELTSNPAKKRN